MWDIILIYAILIFIYITNKYVYIKGGNKILY